MALLIGWFRNIRLRGVCQRSIKLVASRRSVYVFAFDCVLVFSIVSFLLCDGFITRTARVSSKEAEFYGNKSVPKISVI